MNFYFDYVPEDFPPEKFIRFYIINHYLYPIDHPKYACEKLDRNTCNNSKKIKIQLKWMDKCIENSREKHSKVGWIKYM